VDSVLRHWAPWGGVYGVSAMAAALAMVLGARRGAQISWRERFLAPRAPRVLLRGGVVTVVLAGLAYTWWTAPTRQVLEHDSTRSGLTVRLLQGNVSQDMKFGAGVGQALRDYREALWHNDADLIVTPETAIPMLPEYLPEGYWRTLQQRYASGNQAALVGVPLRSGAGYTNSVLGWAPGAPTYRYDKHHLVPFGEFVPPWFRWFVDRMHIPLGDFSRGAVVQAPLTWKGERIAPNICYEDLFGEELARGFADPRTAPTLLLNLSNIAWFGDTVAIDQHLHISRMRAMELGRPMLRATNTGATAYIDAHGVVVQRLPSSVQGALSVRVQGVDGPPTPYARWVSTQGLWPLAGMAFAVLLLAAMVGRFAGTWTCPLSGRSRPNCFYADISTNHSQTPVLLGCPRLRPAATL
jgi:apolipoprotein N-acyltransferase